MSSLPPGPPPPPGVPGPPPGWGAPPPGAPPAWGAPPPSAPPPGGYGGHGAWGGPPPPPGAPPPGAGGPPSGGSRAPLVVGLSVVVVLVVVAVAGGVVLLTRGGDDRAQLSSAEMRRALLEVDDVGDGFTEEDDGSGGADVGEIPSEDVETSDECVALLEEYEDAEGDEAVLFAPTTDEDGASLPSAEVTFDDDDGVEVNQGITTDEDTLGQARRFVEACEELAYDGEDEGVGEVTFSVDDGPDVGDASIRVDITVSTTEPVEVEAGLAAVLWARDGIVSSVTLSGAIDDDLEAEDPDEDLLEDLVQEADERLQEAIDEDG